jgi:hypothetical protein
MAKAFDVRQQTIGRWEDGARPQRRFWSAIADFLGLPDAEVVGELVAAGTTAEIIPIHGGPPPVPIAPVDRRDQVIDVALEKLQSRTLTPAEAEVLGKLIDLVGEKATRPSD